MQNRFIPDHNRPFNHITQSISEIKKDNTTGNDSKWLHSCESVNINTEKYNITLGCNKSNWNTLSLPPQPIRCMFHNIPDFAVRVSWNYWQGDQNNFQKIDVATLSQYDSQRAKLSLNQFKFLNRPWTNNAFSTATLSERNHWNHWTSSFQHHQIFQNSNSDVVLSPSLFPTTGVCGRPNKLRIDGTFILLSAIINLTWSFVWKNMLIWNTNILLICDDKICILIVGSLFGA